MDFMPGIDTTEHQAPFLPEAITTQGYFEGDIFPGVNLMMVNLASENAFSIDFEKHDNTVEFGFVLNGKARASLASGAYDPIEMGEKSAIVHFLPHMPGTFEALPGSCIRMLGIEVDTRVLKQLLHDEKHLCPRLESALRPGSNRHFVRGGDMAAVQAMIIDQMFACPYFGQAGTLFLQSKVLELIAFQVNLLTGSRPRPDYVSAGDEERIRHARNLLKSRMTEAPTLPELSALVGLSPSKLKKGFKAVYGKTAYACLHEDRMETARTLLAERQMNVSEVAWDIGYINVGHFSTAFRKHFGIRPKEFQLKYA